MYNYKPWSHRREYLGEANYLELYPLGPRPPKPKPTEEKKPTLLDKLADIIFK